MTDIIENKTKNYFFIYYPSLKNFTSFIIYFFSKKQYTPIK